MKSLCIVFPMPARYFGDMIEACIGLQSFYQEAAAYPRYVATMKRPYYFENARGEYGEFECGDRFIIFQGEPEQFHPKALFFRHFPSPDLLKEVQWEGIDFRIGTVAIDPMLEQTFAQLCIGINSYSENDWIRVEDYSSFIALSQTS